jgi:hypothetical protein
VFGIDGGLRRVSGEMTTARINEDLIAITFLRGEKERELTHGAG